VTAVERRVERRIQEGVLIAVDQPVLGGEAPGLFGGEIEAGPGRHRAIAGVEGAGRAERVGTRLGAVQEADPPFRLAQDPVDDGMASAARHADDAQLDRIDGHRRSASQG